MIWNRVNYSVALRYRIIRNLQSCLDLTALAPSPIGQYCNCINKTTGLRMSDCPNVYYMSDTWTDVLRRERQTWRIFALFISTLKRQRVKVKLKYVLNVYVPTHSSLFPRYLFISPRRQLSSISFIHVTLIRQFILMNAIKRNDTFSQCTMYSANYNY